MEVKLRVLGGKKPGQEIAVQGPKFVIGRAEDCQMRPRSDMVSRHHCEILLEEGSVAIHDFGSKNGTFVNGEPVKGQQALKSGDVLKVGPLEFEVQLAVNLSGKKKPKVHNVHEAAARTVESATDRDKDIDVTNWLMDDDDDDNTVTGEAVRATMVVPTPHPETATPQGAAPAGAEADAEKPPEKPAPLFGPPPPPKPTAASSRSAAADMLKQMFRRP